MPTCRIAGVEDFRASNLQTMRPQKVSYTKEHLLNRKVGATRGRAEMLLEKYPHLLKNYAWLSISKVNTWGKSGVQFAVEAARVNAREVVVDNGLVAVVPDTEEHKGYVYLTNTNEGLLMYFIGSGAAFGLAKTRLSAVLAQGRRKSLFENLQITYEELHDIYTSDLLDKQKVRLYGAPREASSTEVLVHGKKHGVMGEPITHELANGKVSVVAYPSRFLTPTALRETDPFFVEIAGRSQTDKEGTISCRQVDMSELHRYVQGHIIHVLKRHRGGKLFSRSVPVE